MHEKTGESEPPQPGVPGPPGPPGLPGPKGNNFHVLFIS